MASKETYLAPKPSNIQPIFKNQLTRTKVFSWPKVQPGLIQDCKQKSYSPEE